MEKVQDKLVICPCCGSDACYESEFTTHEGKVRTWLCMTCGFTTNTTMIKDSDTLKLAMENTSAFIVSLKQIHNNLVWLPTVITMPNKGMIFPEPIPGTKTLDSFDSNEVDWKWTVVKAIDVKEEEKEKYPIPNKPGEFYKTRMDMEGVKRFDKLCFMDAAEELGMFDPNLVN